MKIRERKGRVENKMSNEFTLGGNFHLHSQYFTSQFIVSTSQAQSTLFLNFSEYPKKIAHTIYKE